MPRMKVVPKIRPCEVGFEMEVRAVDLFYKWRKEYREVGYAYAEAVDLGLATLEGDEFGRLSVVKRTLKSEAWINTERLEQFRFQRF